MCVIDGFECLRHDAIVGGNDQHNDVRGLGSARTHAGKRFVTGSIKKHDLAAIRGRLRVLHRNFIRADVLGDASRFASGDVGRANRIQQCSLAVIDVAHNCDHGRTRHAFAAPFFPGSGVRNFFCGLLFESDYIRIRTEEAGHFAGQFGVESLIDRCKNPARQQARDQILSANPQLFSQVFYADSFRNRDAARDRLRLIRQR